jgi:putative redox protein
MVTMKALYQGQKHCLLTHGPSNSTIETDAPKDNQGKGERFSPTDLVGAALASCVLTTMAIVAERDSLNLDGASAEVEKHMVADPRRIGALPLKVTLPRALNPEQRQKLESVARHCPVHQSLHPELKIEIVFIYA